ncbi:hypothetical protein [uncultured Chitinophaga sp.]|uniref:hypothetical protein n=1 Tax=uncultured Chitinophaga sp. TaxID=339340 RepID=UPI00260B0ABC|nr:hypothetical protein [uncultured Chitinophaga sp.]
MGCAISAACNLNAMKHDIRLAVADDHEIYLDGLALMLSRQDHIKLEVAPATAASWWNWCSANSRMW